MFCRKSKAPEVARPRPRRTSKERTFRGMKAEVAS
jgi:hypothetical protein